jgi:hypothetical protein
MTSDVAPFGDEDDFWAEPEERSQYGIRNGRYQFPAPPGYTMAKGQRGFMRMTNLASAFSDQIRLQHWRERMLLLGLRVDEALFDELAAAPLETMDAHEAKEYLEAMADRAVKVAGGDRGARMGTARHVMLQTALETGVITGTRTMRLQLESLFEALGRHHLKPIPGWTERRVCNPAYHVVGTLDMGVECQLTGQIGILDLKTQRQFWSYLEICGQQEGYDGAPWAWEGPEDDRGAWVKAPDWNLIGLPGGPAPGKRVALLAHMPKSPDGQMLPVEIHEVDLEFGQEVLDTALKNVQLRSRGAAQSVARRVGGVRPIPRIRASVGLALPAIAE